MRFKAKLALEQVSLFHSLLVPLSKIGGGGGGGSGTIGSEGNPNGTRTGTVWGGGRSGNASSTVLSLDDHYVKVSCKGSGGGGGSSSNIATTSNNSSNNSNNNSNNSSIHDGIICYSELSTVDGIFLEHRIESAAPNNQIVMEIDLVQLKLALKSVLSAKSSNSGSNSGGNISTSSIVPQYSVIKLAKRQNIPCLCLDAAVVCNSKNGNSNNGTTIHIHHAIPVRIVRYNEFELYHLPPRIPLPDVQLELNRAECASLRTVLDKLKLMCPICYLEANKVTGQFTVRVHTDGASVKTFYSNLSIRQEGCRQEEVQEDEEEEKEGETHGHNNDDNNDNDSNNDEEQEKENENYNNEHRQQHHQQPYSTVRRKRNNSNNTANSNNSNNNYNTKRQKRTKTNIGPVTIKVDTRKLAACLQWQNQSSNNSSSSSSSNNNNNNSNTTGSISNMWITSALLCLVVNEMLVVHVTLNPSSVGFFTYYIPVHYYFNNHNNRGTTTTGGTTTTYNNNNNDHNMDDHNPLDD